MRHYFDYAITTIEKAIDSRRGDFYVWPRVEPEQKVIGLEQEICEQTMVDPESYDLCKNGAIKAEMLGEWGRFFELIMAEPVHPGVNGFLARLREQIPQKLWLPGFMARLNDRIKKSDQQDFLNRVAAFRQNEMLAG